MGVRCERNGGDSDQNFEKPYTPMYPDDPQTSPLDLTIRRPAFPLDRSMSIDESPSSPVRTIAELNAFMKRQMSVDCECNAPVIVTEPKTEWHYRSIKDLEKNHIPYLSGMGPQRTPIRVTVPGTSNDQMYLVISVVTYDKSPHPSKVIVPSKTSAHSKRSLRDNDLTCLNFDKCDPMEYLDPGSGHVYLPISGEEHTAGLKEIRVHMFNLYQNEKITKDLIESRQLHQFRLAFWFCYRQFKREIRISPTSYSDIIQEKKHSTSLRVSQQMHISSGLSNCDSMVPENYFKEDPESNDSEFDSN